MSYFEDAFRMGNSVVTGNPHTLKTQQTQTFRSFQTFQPTDSLYAAGQNRTGQDRDGIDYRKTTGRIFDIQRYSVHDGPGIRTIVFLEGCVLRCRWCCNPESQEYRIQEMKQADGSIKIVGEDKTVEEVMREVNKDRMYYRRSRGGLTLSGGESLCQPDFARDLLHAAKDEGFTTALESMAYASYDKIEAILPYLDTYLMDIKHMNGRKHEEFTGKSNELMLENSRKVAASGQCELIIRTPVIPTFNDTNEEISAIARHAASLPGVKEMHLLPYHRLGYDKYIGLGRTYQMGDLKTPPRESFLEFKRIVESYGLTCVIGG